MDMTDSEYIVNLNVSTCSHCRLNDVIAPPSEWRAKFSPRAFLVSIVDSISACHAEDRGSIPRRGEYSTS